MEVKIQLKSRAIFLSGEKLLCSVTFTNVGRRRGNDGNEVFSDRIQESLAWSSVQIQCLCQSADASGTAESNSGYGATSLKPLSSESGSGYKTTELASTPPKILFCDLTLAPGESRTYVYEDIVPTGCPSTYHGRHIRYSYRLIVASQRINCPIATLRVPIRILAIPRDALDSEKHQPGPQKDKPSITNPFATKSDDEDESSDAGDADSSHLLLNEGVVRKKATYYDIRASGGRKVGKICLFKSSFKLGEDVLGMFDLSDVDVACLQYSVSLICEEKMANNSHTKAVSKQSFQEFCFGYAETSFSLAVPLHATPTFKINDCQLDWMLRFEFVIGKDQIKHQPFIDENSDVTSMGHEWNGPHKVEVETMTWNLPVTLLPTHPQNLAQCVQVPLCASITV